MSFPLPSALLLDFGGVLVVSEKPAGWQEKVAEHIIGILHRSGVPGNSLPAAQRVLEDVTAADIATGLLSNAMSRPRHPQELTHRSYVLDFIAADWDQQARSVLEPHVTEICYRISSTKEHRVLRRGTEDLLRWCEERGIPAVVVSNALCGQVHRDYLDAAGLSDRFTAEIYSDEEGVRKPNPDLILAGSRAAQVPVEQCWYVGDHLDRDVLCGVRAGVGVNVLMPAPGAAVRPFTVPVEPHLTVGDPAELLETLISLREGHGPETARTQGPAQREDIP